MFEGLELAGESVEFGGVYHQAANDQGRLIDWLWRIVQFSEVSVLVQKADFRLGLKGGYGHRMVAIGSAARDRVGNSVFLGGHMDRILQNANGQIRGPYQAACPPRVGEHRLSRARDRRCSPKCWDLAETGIPGLCEVRVRPVRGIEVRRRP